MKKTLNLLRRFPIVVGFVGIVLVFSLSGQDKIRWDLAITIRECLYWCVIVYANVYRRIFNIVEDKDQYT